MNISIKWVAMSTLVIIVFAIIGGIIGAVIGDLGVSYLFIFLSFFAGGIITGKKSPGKTVIEPGIASAIALSIMAIVFDAGGSMFSMAVAFIMGVAGGYFGERWQGAGLASTAQPALPQQPPAETRFCPSCGKPLTYIPEYKAYYCYDCQKYPEI